MNLLIAAFAENILIATLALAFYTYCVGVHAKDVSVDGDQAYA